MPLELLRITILSQEATNSVIQFIQVIITILENLFPKIAILFINNIGVKGPYIDYNRQLILLGIRRFVFEYF